MSYDYNALVTSLESHRSNATIARKENDVAKYAEHLQESVEVFDTLSGHCPMTPLLWMQYAYDMGELMTALSAAANASSPATAEAAQQTRLQTLELALNEFPGSAVLQLHYCELLVSSLTSTSTSIDEETRKTVHQALLRALQQVGSGSHRNEGAIVAQLYRVHVHFAVTFLTNGKDAGLASLLQRAKTPMQNANDGLMNEIQQFCAKAKVPAFQNDFLPTIEEARRWEAKTYSRLRPCEDEVTVAMHQEQIIYESIHDLFTTDTDADDEMVFVTTTRAFEEAVLWGKLLPDDQPRRYWMGLGGALTAQAFLQYAAACRKFRFPKEEDDDNDSQDKNKQQQQQLIINVLERGIAECPTVESMWLAYLKHLTWLWNNNDTKSAPTPLVFKTASNRAVRNCPFSLALAQQQLQISLLLANKEGSDYVMDPDELMQNVTKALDSKFLPAPGQALDLFVTAIRVVQRRILSILATTVTGFDPTVKKPKHAVILKFDDAELLPSQSPKNAEKSSVEAATLDDDAWQEVQDLCEELRDMFDAAFARLNQDHASWTEGRAILEDQRSRVEQMVIVPLMAIDSPDTSDVGASKSNGNDNTEVLSHLEKVIRIHRPAHPDSYKALIEHVFHHGVSSPNDIITRSPGDIMSRLRQVRGLYQKALQTVGKAKAKDPSQALQTISATSPLRDYESALACLCHDYQEFERLFGSEQSLANATRQMQKKLQKTSTFQQSDKQHSAAPAATGQRKPAAAPKQKQDQEGTTAMDVDEKRTRKDKRKAPQADEPIASVAEKMTRKDKRKARHMDEQIASDVQDQPPAKKHRGEENDGAEKSTPTPAPAPQPKQHHKVKIGHIFHKAHPFTVRISNLANETEEMDIIEFFKQQHKCGAVVHCRIQREKLPHNKGPKSKVGTSKGWGLLQFEERDSVEKALELDQKEELHGKALHVERSHVPAVGVVPPGMHRPKQHAKDSGHEDDEQAQAGATGDDKQSTDGTKKSGNDTKTSSSSVGVLAFRPRGIAQHKKKPLGSKRARPKVKLALSAKNDGTGDGAAK